MANGNRSNLDRSLDELAKELSGKDRSRSYTPETGDQPHPKRAKRLNRIDLKECSVYIGNLAYETTPDDLRQHMSKAGWVDTARIFQDPTGASKGCAIVRYFDKQSARNAISSLHGTELFKRKIIVREDRDGESKPPPPIGATKTPFGISPSPQCTVFVGNLDYTVDWCKLKDTFKVAGHVLHAEVNMNKDGKSKGSGIVVFETSLEALTAVALFHGQMLFNRPMVVRMDRDAPTQADPTLLKLNMKLGTLMNTGAVQLSAPGILEPTPPSSFPGASGGFPEPFGRGSVGSGSSHVPSSHGLDQRPVGRGGGLDIGIPSDGGGMFLDSAGGPASESILSLPGSGSRRGSIHLFEEELAELRKRQAARNNREIEELMKWHFGKDVNLGMLSDLGVYLGGEMSGGFFDVEPGSLRGHGNERLGTVMGRSVLEDELRASQLRQLSPMHGYPLSKTTIGGGLPARDDVRMLPRGEEMTGGYRHGLSGLTEMYGELESLLGTPRRHKEGIFPLPGLISPSHAGGGRRVFVRNLPPTVTSRNVRNFFSREIGTVTFAEIKGPSGKGMAVVEFATPQLASQAISEFDRRNLNGRTLGVTADKFDPTSGGGQ